MTRMGVGSAEERGPSAEVIDLDKDIPDIQIAATAEADIDSEPTAAQALPLSQSKYTGSAAVARLRTLAKITKGENAPWVDEVSLNSLVPELVPAFDGSLLGAQIAYKPRVYRMPPSSLREGH